MALGMRERRRGRPCEQHEREGEGEAGEKAAGEAGERGGGRLHDAVIVRPAAGAKPVTGAWTTVAAPGRCGTGAPRAGIGRAGRRGPGAPGEQLFRPERPLAFRSHLDPEEQDDARYR